MKVRKDIPVYVIVVMLLIFSIVPNTLAATVNENALYAGDPVKHVISQYFDNYFKSYQTLEVVNSDNLVEDNENTLLYKKMHELSVEANKLVRLSYTTFKVTLDYQNISYLNDTVNVNLLMSCDYVYSSTPDAKSSIGNINYKFSLIHENDEYKIISIDSNFDEFDNFKKSVEEKVSSSKISKIDAINKTAEEKSQEIRDTVKYISGNSLNSENNPADSTTSSNEVMPLGVNSTYSFNRMLARNWAQRFAEADESDRFFYTAYTPSENDCTNFVSQCIWAGYGGYVEGNDTQTKNNINNRVRMVNNVWQAGTGGGVPNWESVTNLWSYATTNTGNGPRATGLNNDQPYYNLSPSSIYYGNAIQARTGSSGNYTHSVFVTYSLDSSTTEYNQVLVSQHTGDMYNRNLWELITSKGGNNCYLRKMSFKNANFSS
ncbi:amidase domain-containing protein [Desulfosporosinus nitroreducens]|uniref:amidase domain-containing protein n=1 Tax=Desulfosporosinus nitroreducens TaxID=2018668 RepID=UPI00207C456F|nr:amidase domain-containing protein [Desulfosporosinus nitroreducens]MCO1600862.1 amidase domain-containing protein [Desulfosporosinus nitroreducens]